MWRHVNGAILGVRVATASPHSCTITTTTTTHLLGRSLHGGLLLADHLSERFHVQRCSRRQRWYHAKPLGCCRERQLWTTRHSTTTTTHVMMTPAASAVPLHAMRLLLLSLRVGAHHCGMHGEESQIWRQPYKCAVRVGDPL
jgi:hypothetical protein